MTRSNIQKLFRTAVLLLGISTLATGSSVMANVISLAPPIAFHGYPHALQPRAVRVAGSAAKRSLDSPVGCSTNYAKYSFVGIAGVYNVAGGENSGVVAGDANEACDGDTGIFAGSGNVIGGSGETYYSVVAGGANNAINFATYSFIGGGGENFISGVQQGGYQVYNDAIVAGGSNSIAGPNSIIGAGQNNTIAGAAPPATPYGQNSSIGAGNQNAVSGNNSVIGAGQLNSVSGSFSSIDSGTGNNVSAEYSAIGGGFDNVISGEYATIGAGYGNTASGLVATVSGGYENSASGRNAAIPGGAYNVASGIGSLAAGYKANALNQGAFVWSDNASGSSTLASTAANQFVARASGGFFFYSSPNLSSGVKLPPGSGSWSTLSDRNSKMQIKQISDDRILSKIAKMSVSEWSYKGEGSSVRHLGPMAQDFRAAFGLGEDDRHISTVDEEGVALAAIKALQAEVLAKDHELAELRRSNSEIRKSNASRDKEMTALAKRLDALERNHG